MSRLPSAAQGSRSRAAGQEPAARDLTRAAAAAQLGPDEAQQLLASLGFLLVPGPPFDRAPAYLLVALRRSPTLSHFDPERIEVWTPCEAGTSLSVLEWPLECPTTEYSWGTVDIVDRVAAVNRFASFGGSISIIRDHDIHAALLRSDAPILSAGGHSGPADPLGHQVAAYFGILRAAAGNDVRLGRLINGASPQALYAAFLARSLAIYEADYHNYCVGSRALSLLRQERCRLAREVPDDQLAGERLAQTISSLRNTPTQEVNDGRAI